MNKNFKHFIYELLFGLAITFICLSVGALIAGIKIENVTIIIISIVVIILMGILLLFLILTVPYGPYENKKRKKFYSRNLKKKNKKLEHDEE